MDNYIVDLLYTWINQNNLKRIAEFSRTLEDINEVLITVDDNNLNLLHIVCSVDSIFRDEVLHVLLTADGIDLNKHSGIGNDGFTAAHIAACYGFASTLRLLLQHGADPFIVDIGCNTVWDIAATNGNFECIEVLETEINNAPLPLDTKKDFTLVEADSDDAIYYSFSSLTLDGDDANTTIKPNDQSTTIFVKASDNPEMTKIEEHLSQRAPTSSRSKQSPTTKKPSPPRRHNLNKGPRIITKRNKANDTIYFDQDFNVTLVESSSVESILSISSSELGDKTLVSVDPDLEKLSNLEIRQQLVQAGLSPGPIGPTTRNIMLKQLKKIRSTSPALVAQSPTRPSSQPLASYSSYINSILLGEFNFPEAQKLERQLREMFLDDKGPKEFFNYILLDPRVASDISEQVIEQQSNRKLQKNLFVKYIKAIFYIGKGKSNRPYMHLYEAISTNKKNAKVKRITEIWDQGFGVVSSRVFQGMSSHEALACESLMIDAIGIDKLTNERLGQDKVRSLGWTDGKKLILGTYLLYKAFNTLLYNGERQIKRGDIS